MNAPASVTIRPVRVAALLAEAERMPVRRELDDACSEDAYTIREWVEAPDVRYVPVDGERRVARNDESSRRTRQRWAMNPEAHERSRSQGSIHPACESFKSATGRTCIEPGSPRHTPFVESFGSRVRDAALSVQQAGRPGQLLRSMPGSHGAPGGQAVPLALSRG